MSETRDSILDALKFRLNSFLASVIVSWPIINYKFMMVIFGGGNYKSKFQYINEELYKDGGKFFYLVIFPILVGLFYQIIFPFINIGFDFIDRWIKNLHRRVMFHRDCVDVISQAEKDNYFAFLEGTNLSIRDELRAARAAENLKVTSMRNEMDGLAKRFQSVVCKKVCNSLTGSDLNSQMLVSILTIYPDNFHSMPADFIEKFANSEFFDKSYKFVDSLMAMNYDNPIRKVALTIDDIKMASGVSAEKIDDFIDYFIAFELMEQTDFSSNKFITKDRTAQADKKFCTIE